MISRITSQWRRFRRDESGATYLIGFVLWMPAVFLTLTTALEIGFYTARSTMLERGMDMVTRDIRLGTGFSPSHDEIKDQICERANVIPNCSQNLRLEMILRDPRDWQDIPQTADCTDRALEVAPVRQFTNGMDNQLMVLRACAKFEPFYNFSWFYDAMEKDTAGDYAIVATTAFVQEPR